MQQRTDLEQNGFMLQARKQRDLCIAETAYDETQKLNITLNMTKKYGSSNETEQKLKQHTAITSY